jgi:hypothetical protein
LNGLAEYVRPKNSSEAPLRGRPNDGHNSSVAFEEEFGDRNVRAGNTSSIFALSVAHPNDGSSIDLSKNQFTPQPLNANGSSLHRRKTFSSADNTSNIGSSHPRTPLMRRFKRDRYFRNFRINNQLLRDV